MRRVLVGLLLLAAAGVAGTGCSGPLPDAIAGPVIVEGTFTDTDGSPIGGAEVILQVQDWANAVDPCKTVETVFSVSTKTDPAGRFVFRGLPSPEVLDYAGAAGAVNFDLTGIPSGTSDFAVWSFERGLDGPAWVGDAPQADLRIAEGG